MYHKKFYYGAASGQMGCYGMSCPVDRDRAKRLLRYAVGTDHKDRGYRRIALSVIPREAKFATLHGARGGFLVISLA